MTTEQPPEYWLQENFKKVLGLSEEACSWLIDLWRVIQVFDDMADSDDVDRAELNKAIWSALIRLPVDPYYSRNAAMLIPLVMTAILKWQASDDVERDGRANATSFVWRAGYYDVVLACVLIDHGPEIASELAPLVLDFYGEDFGEYLEDMADA